MGEEADSRVEEERTILLSPSPLILMGLLYTVTLLGSLLFSISVALTLVDWSFPYFLDFLLNL